MPRPSAKAENARAAPKTVSLAETFASMWPMEAAGMTSSAAIDNLRRMSEVQIEIARFAAERVRKNTGTLAAMATCRSPMEFLHLWSQATTDAMTDYAEELARILERSQH